MDTILAIDIGTTSMRGILFDRSGTALRVKQIRTPLVYREQFIEQSPETLMNALLGICRDIAAFRVPDAVTLTAFRSAPTLVDMNGDAITNFIMWQDTRNRSICERLAPYGKKLRSATGAGVNAVFTASKITWWKENEPDLFAKAYKAMIVPDYLMQRMTGVFATDFTYGSRTSLMDLTTLSWDPELFSLFDLPEDILSPLIAQGSVFGTVTETFANESGLCAGTPVISAGGDQQCGALGLGAVSEDQLVINCGTGSFILGLSDTPEFSEQDNICNVSAIPGKYIVESNVLSSAASLDWMMREMFPDLQADGKPDYAAFNALAASAPPCASGVACVPLFQGCGTRNWNPDARASFCGLSLATTRADLARSLYEGIAAEIQKSILAFPERIRHASQAFLGGGMTKSDVFSQILADVTGLELIRYADGEATAIGAFLSAAVTLGLYPDHATAFHAIRKDSEKTVFTPDEGNHALYRSLTENTERIYRTLCHCSE